MLKFMMLECKNCNSAYKIRPEKLVAHEANIQCPYCGYLVNNKGASDKYHQSINDFKRHLIGIKKT